MGKSAMHTIKISDFRKDFSVLRKPESMVQCELVVAITSERLRRPK